jgi:hypothetical protein
VDSYNVKLYLEENLTVKKIAELNAQNELVKKEGQPVILYVVPNKKRGREETTVIEVKEVNPATNSIIAHPVNDPEKRLSFDFFTNVLEEDELPRHGIS